MSGIALGAAAIGAVGSGLAAKSSADAQMEAAEMSRELPPWLEPYMTSPGVPNYVYQNPAINPDWMGHIQGLAGGMWNSPWAPMIDPSTGQTGPQTGMSNPFGGDELTPTIADPQGQGYWSEHHYITPDMPQYNPGTDPWGIDYLRGGV